MSRTPEEHSENTSNTTEENQKWFKREDLQDLAKLGTGFLKKTVASGIDAIKDVKDSLPKDATSLLQKGKEEIMKGLSQDMAKNLVSYSVEKVFKTASQYKLEFTFRIRSTEEAVGKDTSKKK